jgi:hypothetical protein
MRIASPISKGRSRCPVRFHADGDHANGVRADKSWKFLGMGALGKAVFSKRAFPRKRIFI